LALFSGRVEGGSGWTKSDRYDIVAKSEGVIPPAERSQAVMAILEDRFKLVVHREEKQVAGFALTVGKNPPMLPSSKEGEAPLIRTDDRRQVIFQAVSMVRMANYLGQVLHAPVVDQTGIRGSFDFAVDPYKFAIQSDPAAQTP